MEINKLLEALLITEEDVDKDRMEKPPKTFEDDPMNFILNKYQSLNQMLTDLMSENYKELLTGIFIIAYKPTTFKVVLHNGQYFFLTYMEEAYQATIGGKNYFLLTIGEQQRAMLAIARLLRWGSPLKVKGPEGAEQSTDTGMEEGGGEAPPAETSEPTGEEGGEEESLEESKTILSILINENQLSELARNKYDILSPKAKEITKNLMDKIPSIKKSQIQPKTKNHIVIYNDDRKNVVDAIEALKTYGTRNEKNAGDFKTKEGIIITVKPDKTSGEYYQLKPQFLGITTDKFITVEQLKKQLKTGVKNHPRLSEDQKQFILAMVGGKKPSQKSIDACLQDGQFIKEINKNLGEPIGSIVYAEKIGGKEIFFPTAGNYPLIDYRVKKAKGQIIDVSAKAEGIKGNVVKFADVYKKIKDKNLEGEMTNDQKLIFNTVIASETGENVAVRILKLIDKFGSSSTKSEYKEFLKNNPGFLDKSKRDLKTYPKTGYDSQKMARLQKLVCRDINNNPKYDFSKLFQKAVGTMYVKFYFDKDTLEPHVNVYPSEQISVYLDSKASSGHVGEAIGFQIKTS